MSNHDKTSHDPKQEINSKLKETVVELRPQDPETLDKIRKTEYKYELENVNLTSYVVLIFVILLPILLGTGGPVAATVMFLVGLLYVIVGCRTNRPEALPKNKKQINNFVSNPDKLIEAINKALDEAKANPLDEENGYYRTVPTNLLVAIKRSKLENKWIKHMESLEGEELKNYFDKIPLDLSKHKRMMPKLWERPQNCRAVPVEAVLVETMTVEAKLVKKKPTLFGHICK